MTTMTDTAVMTPREIDTELAALWGEGQKIKTWLASEVQWLERSEAAVAKSPWVARDIEQAKERIAAHKAALAEIDAKATPLEVEWDTRGGWNRYFLVTNSNGHVHRGMNCTTCFATTQYAWLPELSDCDEDVMIEQFGEDACTVCFPSAPANPRFHAPGSRKAEAIAARAAEKAAKQAIKDAKAISAPDGSPLRVGGNVVRTKIAAQRELSQSVQDFHHYGPSHPSNFLAEIETLMAALECAGIDPRPIMERATKKARKEMAGWDRTFNELPNF